jgi:hypothetical protein
MTSARWFLLSLALFGAAVGAWACNDEDAALEAACGDGKARTPECKAAFEATMNAPDIVENTRRMDSYRLELATSLARRNTVDALLASAAAARWLEIDSPLPRPVVAPPAMATSALLARAEALAPADARVLYTTVLWSRCKPGESNCAMDAAIARLLQVDADNAAAWLMRFQRDSELGDTASARASLTHAAQAPAYRDYSDVVVQDVLGEWLSDPTEMRARPGESTSPLTASQFARWYKLFEASTLIIGGPGDYYLARACDPTAAAKDDPALQADCRAIGSKQDIAGASLFSQSQGRFLQMRLATDAAERERFEVRRREIMWLIHEGSWNEVPDPAKVEEEIAMRLAGVGDVAIRRHIAAARGKVFTPDWRPPPTPYEQAHAQDAGSHDGE